MPEIIPTVVPSRAEDISAALERYPFAKTLHIDIADGTLASNITWMPATTHNLPKGLLGYEAHLMVTNPLSLGIACAKSGVTRLIAHNSSFPNAARADEIFSTWRSAGIIEIGLALTSATALNTLDTFMSLIDFVQLMTIEKIGQQGQSFDEHSIVRVLRLHEHYPALVIAVDGGVNCENIGRLAHAGATRFCVGSALARAKDPASTYKELMRVANAVS